MKAINTSKQSWQLDRYWKLMIMINASQSMALEASLITWAPLKQAIVSHSMGIIQALMSME
jgi:hypothetical protein